MGITRYHMAVNIEGLLRNYKNRNMNGLLLDDNGKRLSDTEARAYLNDCLSKGIKLITSQECEGFDPYENGCPGHPIQDS